MAGCSAASYFIDFVVDEHALTQGACAADSDEQVAAGSIGLKTRTEPKNTRKRLWAFKWSNDRSDFFETQRGNAESTVVGGRTHNAVALRPNACKNWQKRTTQATTYTCAAAAPARRNERARTIYA